MCDEYAKCKNAQTEESFLFIEEIKKWIPTIEQIIEIVSKIKNPSTFLTIFEKVENITYENIFPILSFFLEQYKKKQENIRFIKNIFNNCKTKQELFEKIEFLNTNYGNMETSVLPNYTEFLKFVKELEEQIPDTFPTKASLNYEILYQIMFENYLTKKEKELVSAKKAEEMYKKALEVMKIQYQLLTNGEELYHIKSKQDLIKDGLALQKKSLKQEERKKEKQEEEQERVREQKEKLQSKNVIFRFLKKKEIDTLSSELEQRKIEEQEIRKRIEEEKTKIENLQSQQQQNEQYLKKISGLSLTDFNAILEKWTTMDLTKEEIVKKYSEIQKKLEALEVPKKESEVMSLYEKREKTAKNTKTG